MWYAEDIEREDNMVPKPTDDDIDHCFEAWRELQEPCDSPDCLRATGEFYSTCDCRSSDTVCLSFGYAEVWNDGDVIAYGHTIANVKE